MRHPVRSLLLFLAACLVSLTHVASAAGLPAAPAALAQADPSAGITRLLGRLEQVMQAGDRAAYLQLLTPSADRKRAMQFASQYINPGVARVVVRERDRGELPGTLPGEGYEVLVEVFVESAARAWLGTWGLDLRHVGPGDDWGIVDQRSVTSLQGLYRLTLNAGREFTARNLVVTAEDLRLTLESGSVFVCEVESGITGLVLIGKGDMTFTPTPEVERNQIRLFAGSESLASPFEIAFVRLHPGSLDSHLNRAALTERPVDARDLKRAEDVFRQDVVRSFGLDLGDLSSEHWSLLPSPDDFLAEIRTRRFDTLTYSRSASDVEDISVFDRKNHRNLTVYESKAHLQQFTPFFNEDDHAEFFVKHYDLDVSFDPTRRWLQGRARLNIVTRAALGTSTLTIRIADSLAVRSIVSNEYGRLLYVRVRNHSAIVVNLPATFTSGVSMTLNIDYAGSLVPQPIDREVLSPQNPSYVEQPQPPIEDSFLYSTRSYWYPQAPVLNYSTAQVRISVPQPYSCSASGDLMAIGKSPDGHGRQFTFVATQPVRYLAFVVTRLVDVDTTTLHLASLVQAVRPPRLSGAFYDDVQVVTKASPRMKGRARAMAKTAQDIIRFYTSVIGDCPYPTITLAVVEQELPGGHSPGYLSVVAQPSVQSRFRVADDPASFTDYPEFYLAHELAHQWWGQAVGWMNYHEQWLSEGFAQYFAALYAEHARGKPVFESMLIRMRNWAEDKSDAGPIYLGYRIGHVRNDSRLFRAIVYDKSAVVLHMMRQLVGDRAFFEGIRRFYDLWRFDKAGSEDLRKSIEAVSHVSLARFFERWVYGEQLPQLALTWRVEQNDKGPEAVLRIDQQGAIFDIPVPVILDYADKPREEVLISVTDKVAEVRVPLAGNLRRADIDHDRALAIVREAGARQAASARTNPAGPPR